MLNRTAALIALMVVPTLAAAQRGGASGSLGKDPKPNYDGPGRDKNAALLSTRDLENISPVKLLIDKRKNLALTEDQTKQLKDMDVALKTKNESYFKDLDSLRREMKPSDAVPEVERLRIQGVRASVATVVTAVRGNYDAAEPDALKLLTEDQQKTAKDLLAKQREEADEMLRQKLGGGRRGS